MVYVVTAIPISIFNVLPILNIGLHSRIVFICNCTLFLTSFNIWYGYALQEFMDIFKGFAQNQKYNLLIQSARFLIHLALVIYIWNQLSALLHLTSLSTAMEIYMLGLSGLLTRAQSDTFRVSIWGGLKGRLLLANNQPQKKC